MGLSINAAWHYPYGTGTTGGQFYANTFSAGDYLTVNISNYGKNTATGFDNQVGVLQNQLDINNCTCGDHATFNLSNMGEVALDGIFNIACGVPYGAFLNLTAGSHANFNLTNSGTLTDNGSFKVAALYGQALIAMHVGDNANVSISNSGSYVGDGTSCFAGVQDIEAAIVGPLTTGQSADITVSSKGTLHGDGDDNFTGIVSYFQLFSFAEMEIGDNSTISVTNSGTYSGVGSTNQVGVVGGATGSPFPFENQIYLESAILVGNDVQITVANSGDYTGTDATNLVGYISGYQFDALESFVAGTNLVFSVTNSASTATTSPTQVGIVNFSQIAFENTCTIGDGSSITAYNSGSVGQGPTGSEGATRPFAQIAFNDGFTISSGGKALFSATHAPNVDPRSIGIYVGADSTSTGGDVDITLQNSSFVVASTVPSFTIGELNGDHLSYVTSVPSLVIDTDASVVADFEGDIRSVLSLVKTGVGTQQLSGANTFATPSTVAQGILNLTGSMPGNITVNAAGTLEGTGVASGTVSNNGTVIPGVGAGGVLTVGNYIQSSSGTLFINALNATPGNWGQLMTTSTSLAGNLVVNVLGPFFAGQEILVVNSANVISGGFANLEVQNNPPSLVATLITTPNQISVLFESLNPPTNLSATCLNKGLIEYAVVITGQAPATGPRPTSYNIYSNRHLNHLLGSAPQKGMDLGL